MASRVDRTGDLAKMPNQSVRLKELEARNAALEDELARYRDAAERTRRSEERLRLVHEATGLADFETDASGVSICSDRFFEQCGLPMPVKAGTKYTPPLSATLAASASTSCEALMSPSPSRSHCTTAPAMNTLPSSAYCGSPPRWHAAVVSSRLDEATGRPPVCINMKHPVP